MERLWDVRVGDCREALREMADGSVQTCVTSPPYFGLRDYGTASWEGGDPECDHRKVSDTAGAVATSTLGGGKKTTGHQQEGYREYCGRCGAKRVDNQIGLESSLDAYVAELVGVFREVKRVLRDDGTLWLNLGDSYASAWPCNRRNVVGAGSLENGKRENRPPRLPDGLKEKDLLGVPWRVAFALQADGWYLRSDIIWHKPNPMPESVRDRPTKAHEYVFLLTKSPRYFYDADAIREPMVKGAAGSSFTEGKTGVNGFGRVSHAERHDNPAGRNKRTVWTITPKPFKGAHFAVMPPALVEPCILAGSRPGDLVLDPFNGSGTVGVVALTHGRRYVGVELNPEYAAMARGRIIRDARPHLLAV